MKAFVFDSIKITLLTAFCSISIAALENLDKFQKTALDRHNYYREIAGIPSLEWSKALEKNSEEWARQLQKSTRCRMKHSGKNFRSNKGGFSYIGENLAWRYHSRSVEADKQTTEMMVDGWYNEIADFQYSSQGVICPARGRKQATGHFTQLMWDKTTHLGCAYALCNGNKELLLVCQYGPGGNFNIRRTPPFSPEATAKLDAHPVNKKFGGLPTCEATTKTKKKLDVDKIIKDLSIPRLH